MATEKRMCMECGQEFSSKGMIKVGRKMYCKECSEDLLKETVEGVSVSGKGINIVNQQKIITNEVEPKYSKKVIVKKNYKQAMLFSIFLGWLGVDRFYVNHTGLGIGKLILGLAFLGNITSEFSFMTVLFSIWWVIDIILFAKKSIGNVEWVD